MFRMKRTFCSALLVLSVLSLLLPLPAAAGGFDETVVTVSWEGVWTALLDRLGLLSVLEADGAHWLELDHLRGLARSRPLFAALLALFMLSLGGIPATAGFLGKWFVFSVLVKADMITVAVLGALLSTVALGYYLRVIVVLYMQAPPEGAPAPSAARLPAARRGRTRRRRPDRHRRPDRLRPRRGLGTTHPAGWSRPSAQRACARPACARR